jgi:hypothetical protein
MSGVEIKANLDTIAAFRKSPEPPRISRQATKPTPPLRRNNIGLRVSLMPTELGACTSFKRPNGELHDSQRRFLAASSASVP